MRPHRLLGVHVDGVPGVVVGADRQQCQVEGAQPGAELGEGRRVAGVPAEEHPVPRAGDGPRRPERGVAGEEAAGEVPGLGAGEREAADGRAAVPVQLDDRGPPARPSRAGAPRSRAGRRTARTAWPAAPGPSAGRGGRSGRARSGRRRPGAARPAARAPRAAGSARTPGTARRDRSTPGRRAPAARRSPAARWRDRTRSPPARRPPRAARAGRAGSARPAGRRAAPRASAAAGPCGRSPAAGRASPSGCGTGRRRTAASPPRWAGASAGSRPGRPAGPTRRGPRRPRGRRGRRRSGRRGGAGTTARHHYPRRRCATGEFRINVTPAGAPTGCGSARCASGRLGRCGRTTSDPADDEGGDPACWLRRVCPACGRLADEDPPTRCPACGAELPDD